MIARLATSVAAIALLAACAGEAGETSGKMSAEIRRTAYGVPHIKADNYAGLGYGLGYAAAEDNVCEIAERFVTVSGERARYFGRGENDANITSDLYHKRLIALGELEKLLAGPTDSPDTPSTDARDLARGYAAGYSRFVREAGAEGITDPRCKGQPWLREITETDYWRHVYAGQVLYMAGVVAGAQPPGVGEQGAIPDDPLVVPSELGSNAYGLGKEVTQSGQGMLLGNPHYPWDGPNRFYRMHLMIPGKLNVVGTGLISNASVGIGHTEHIAWTHTVSTARRYGLYELTLDASDPSRYVYEGKSTPMTTLDVTIDVKDEAPITRTFYTTRFGPVVETKDFPWSATTAYAMRAIPQGVRSPDQYLAMWQAKNVRELYTALGRYQATGFNTTAVDSGGEAFFGDMGMMPNVSKALGDSCAKSDTAKKAWTETRVPVLDGSKAACDWATDTDSTAPGVFGASKTPHLFRTDYVSQSNDSHWLTNPKAPLAGFSPIFGDEATARSLRTRLGLDIINDRVAGADGLPGAKFNLATLQGALYQNRHLGAEMARDDLVKACKASKNAKLAPACTALEGWDLRVDPESLEPEKGWTSIRHGSSWIMTVEFTPEGPRSQGILTYSQSVNPNSPHHSDQTLAYSKKEWDDLRFTEEAIEAGTVSRKTITE